MRGVGIHNYVTVTLAVLGTNKAGQDPGEMFKKYPGRSPLLHFKDMHTKQEPFCDVIKDDVREGGACVIDFNTLWKSKDIAGAKYLFGEHHYQGNGKTFDTLDTRLSNITTKIVV